MLEKRRKILVAEDEKPIARALELKLVAAGYEVAMAYNGEDALRELSKKKYDLLLLDLIMPKKNGFEVMAELKKKKQNISILISTNLSQQVDLERATKLGASGFFVKSDIPIAEVVQRVEKILGS